MEVSLRRDICRIVKNIFMENNLRGADIMAIRKTRSDCTVGTFEKTRGLPPGTIRNPDGRDTRSDKKIGTIRKENQK